MPKRMISLIFTLMFWIAAEGQELQKSPAETIYSFSNQYELLPTTSGILVRSRFKDAAYYWQEKIKHFTPSLDSFRQQDLAWSYQGNKGQCLGIKNMQDNSYVIFRINDPKKAQLSIYALLINPQTLRFDDSPILLLQKNSSDLSNQGIRLEQLDNGLIVFLHQQKRTKNQLDTLMAYCYNTQLKLCYQNKFPVVDKAKAFDLTDVKDIIYHQDYLYLLIKNYRTKLKKEEKKKGERYFFNVLSAPNQGRVNQSQALKILTKEDSALIVSASIILDKDHSIKCYGSFRQSNGHCGLFSAVVDSTAKLRHLVYFDYPISIIDKLNATYKQQSKRQNLGLQQLKIKAVLAQEPNKAILVIEQQYSKIYDDKSAGRQQLEWIQNSVVVCLKDSAIIWQQCISNKQRAGGPAFGKESLRFYSHALIQKNNYLYLIMNAPPSSVANEALDTLSWLEVNSPKSTQILMYRIRKSSGYLDKYSISIGPTTGAIVPSTVCINANNKAFLCLVEQHPKPTEKLMSRVVSLRLPIANNQ